VHWENRVPIPRLYPPMPIIKTSPNTGSNESVDDVYRDAESCSRGLWLEPLWDDVLSKYKDTATPFELPDLQQNLPHQKLQMINMCIISGDVANTVDEEVTTKCVDEARHRLTRHLELSQKEGSSDKSENNLPHIEGSSEHTCSVNIDPDAASEFLAMKVSERDLSHIIPPRLQRRLPMTSDALAQHRHLANKLRQGSSRSATESTMLKWQILYPELISDVRAFKSCNRTVLSSYNIGDIPCGEDRHVTFEDFVAWYGGAGALLPRFDAGPRSVQGEDLLINERGLDGITLENLKVRVDNVWGLARKYSLTMEGHRVCVYRICGMNVVKRD
jgi:hypothetical protein